MCGPSNRLLPHEDYRGLIVKTWPGHMLIPFGIKVAEDGYFILPDKDRMNDEDAFRAFRKALETSLARSNAGKNGVSVEEFFGNKAKLIARIRGLNRTAGLPGFANTAASVLDRMAFATRPGRRIVVAHEICAVAK